MKNILNLLLNGVDMTTEAEKLELQVEEAVGQLYAALYKLRQAKLYQEEYDTMGTVIRMLIQDREHLRIKYGVKV